MRKKQVEELYAEVCFEFTGNKATVFWEGVRWALEKVLEK